MGYIIIFLKVQYEERRERHKLFGCPAARLASRAHMPSRKLGSTPRGPRRPGSARYLRREGSRGERERADVG